MTHPFSAIIAEDTDGKSSASLRQLYLSDLPDEPVLVAVEYSTLNYKDGLAMTGKGRICRTLPLICGIDLAGVVKESRDDKWQPGDRVVVNGFGLSESYNGGYSQFQRVKSEWPVKLPEALSTKEAMAIGTAGYTAMLCLQAIEDHGVHPGDGPILVTGAAGGVGSIAVSLLNTLGFEVHASTGRKESQKEFLEHLGATELLDRSQLADASKPLEKEKWAAVIDTVGSSTLATTIAQTRREGIVTACGLAGGMDLPSSVAPFILRGVTLRGIDSVMASLERRKLAWERLSSILNRDHLETLSTTVPMSELLTMAPAILAGEIRGRVVVDVNR
ncbi:MAG: MDR family oxidoreductase [Luminiphilus sp.]